MTNIPSPHDMDFDSDGIVPEFPATFLSNHNNNNTFNGKYNNHNNNNNNNNNNYSPITTPNNNNTNNNNNNNTQPQQQQQQQQSQPTIEWSTMSFSYPKDGIKRKGSIELPINFKYTPISSVRQPFQYETPRPIPFTWSAVNKQLISQLFKLESYICGKVVLELGSGFGIPSIVSLYLGAKYVYTTDGNDDILSILPIIFNKNNISDSKYTIKKLTYNNFNNFQLNAHKHKHIDIILASNIFNNNIQNGLNFYQTIEHFFDNYINKQRNKFIKKQKNEYKNKQYIIPNIRKQFNHFTPNNNKKNEDLNLPITNGGYLPYSIKPKSIIINNNNNNNNNNNAQTINTGTHTGNKSPNTTATTTSTTTNSHNSDDDISTNTITSYNHQLPNTVHNHITSNNNNFKYKSPYFNPGICSLQAIKTISNVQPIVISRFNQLQYDKFNQSNKTNNNYNNINHIPKLTMFNKFDIINESSSDNDDDINMNINTQINNIKIDKKEEKQFLIKSKVNAPILILAIHKNNNNNNKLRNDPFNAFYNKCVNKGYRIQNVLFEWDFEIWIVKA